MIFFLVVEQDYTTEPRNQYIVRGNDALMECEIPSHIADMVEVVGWVDSEANDYRIGNHYGNSKKKLTPIIEHHAFIDLLCFFSG